MERQGYPKHQYGANYRWHEFLTVYNFAGNFIFYSKMHGYEGLDIGMGKLTTHVLNMAQGKAASGMKIEFSVLEGAVWKLLKTIHTNNDGRTGEPLLADEAMRAGQYQLVFHVADYFRRNDVKLPTPAFIDQVPLQFGIADADAHYHVPLLCSPWAYSTYRGS